MQHSRGFRPLISDGVHFCQDIDSKNQLYNDPEKETLKIVTDVLSEMASLFPDEEFHIGCDETGVKGPCSLNSTFSFERTLLNSVQHAFGKIPAGWEEVLFDAGAATPETIVHAWSRHQPAEITATGRKAVMSQGSHFYFTEAAGAYPLGWEKCWFDIATGVPSDQRSLLIGGEASMWTDTYCITNQCGAFPEGPAPPVGSPLFPPGKDEAFGRSVGGMIWPRGYVAAAAFYNFNASQNSTDDSFVDAIWAMNDKLSKRGALVCPSKCECDQLHACGKPY